MKYIKILPALALGISLVTVSCEDSFIEKPSLSGTTVENYYNTADEVRAATSTLYGLPWSGYENRAMDAIGDVMSGNELTGGSDDPPFTNFTFSAAAVRVQSAWSVFYKIGGWTSSLIQAFEEKKKQGGNPEILDPAIAECHFMKGVVYFYIGRIWGDAPIVNDPGAIALSGNFNIPRYFQADVLRFALEELQLAEAGLPETDDPGRVTKYSAKGMMAKLYLYIKDYENAKIKAQEVIDSQKYGLFSNYGALFNTSSNNNNIESLFSIQHQLTQNPWGAANQMNPDRGPSDLQTSEASMWSLYVPSLSILNEYESGDLRRAGSVMEHGWFKPEWKPKNADPVYNQFMASGYKYDTIFQQQQNKLSQSRAHIAKYVVGPGSSFGGEIVLGMNTAINTMVLRYADILLIYAEAVLGDNGSTTDASALQYFNMVRERAGLDPKDVITKDDIMHERRVEFAFEGDYWFDLQRQGFEKAKQIIESQNRGSKDSPIYVTFTEANMLLPIPAGETLQDPKLLEPPVAYYE
jgi:starch-binding outer membrane protein, SusD/RagB family